MEREISSGAMLGIVLLALAAVIGLGFGVFAITKGVANEGTVNVQDSLGTVSTQIFLDYDQKVVSGQQVLSALKTFEGKPYAVLIATKSAQQGGKIAPSHKAYPVKLTIGGTVTTFLNYNAILALTAGGGDWADADRIPITGTGALLAKDKGASIATLKNGSVIVNNGFAANEGNILFDKETGGLYKSGNAEYIQSTSKFQAYVIKDASDNILGILATQQ